MRRFVAILGVAVLTAVACGQAPPPSTAASPAATETPVPGGRSSREFCKQVLAETGVVITPGVGFGEHGERWFRIALTQSEERIREALARLKKVRL